MIGLETIGGIDEAISNFHIARHFGFDAVLHAFRSLEVGTSIGTSIPAGAGYSWIFLRNSHMLFWHMFPSGVGKSCAINYLAHLFATLILMMLR